MRQGYSVKADKPLLQARGVSGTVGQISFKRLAAQLRAAGEVRPDQEIGEMMFDFDAGLIQYTVEPREGQ